MFQVYPDLPGLAFSTFKAPAFATREQKSISGRVLRVIDQPYPIYTYTLNYTILRDKWDLRGFGGLGNPGNGLTYDELRTIQGFFLRMRGKFTPFLFNDPSDNQITGQRIGVGDGVNAGFQLVRTMNGFDEKIISPKLVSAVYFNGILQSPSTYLVNYNTGVITFVGNTPFIGWVVTADFTYYFRVTFAEDSLEFENFLYQLWSLKQVKLVSVLDGVPPMAVDTISWDYIDLPPTLNNPLLLYTCGIPFTIPANMPGSYLTALFAATSSTGIEFFKNGSLFMIATFAASGTVATFGTCGEQTFLPGDVLSIYPARTDATLSSLSGTIPILI